MNLSDKRLVEIGGGSISAEKDATTLRVARAIAAEAYRAGMNHDLRNAVSIVRAVQKARDNAAVLADGSGTKQAIGANEVAKVLDWCLSQGRLPPKQGPDGQDVPK